MINTQLKIFVKKKKKNLFTFIAYTWENTNNFDVLKFH